MCTLGLIVLNQLGAINSIEKSAMKYLYSAEMTIKHKIEDIEKYECDIKSKSYVDCKMAQAEFSTLNSSVTLILKIFRLSIYLGFSMLGLAISGYVTAIINQFKKEI